jgi:hypothetical protein
MTKTPTSKPVVEIVTFRLRAGSDPQAFAAAAARLTPVLRQTGAAQTRTLSGPTDGLWTDHITWSSLDAARAAAQTVVAHPEAAEFLAMINPDGVTMRHAPVQLNTPLE